jgi:toxin CptA
LALVCCVAALPLALAGGAGVLIVVSGWQSVWRGALAPGRHGVIEIEPGEGVCRYRWGQGDWKQGRVEESSRMLPFVVVIDVRTTTNALVHLVVPRDAVTADEFRRLRVWLRWWPKGVQR